MTYRKYDHVEYSLPRTGSRISAIVRIAHRDGSCTVEARHELDRMTGKPRGAYMGYRYRMSSADVRRPA